jgi:hypothetical protein
MHCYFTPILRGSHIKDASQEGLGSAPLARLGDLIPRHHCGRGSERHVRADAGFVRIAAIPIMPQRLTRMTKLPGWALILFNSFTVHPLPRRIWNEKK